MKNREPRRNGEQPSPGTDLSRLIETEERLGQILEQAREEGARIVVAARDAAVAAELEMDRERGRDRERIEVEVKQESSRRAAEALAVGRRAAVALDGLPETLISELARQVVERLVSVAEGGAA